MLRRFEDWPSRLNSYLETRRYAEFGYGSHDCCLFVGDAILAMTGTDIAAYFRNSYRSSLEALRRIRSYTPFATVEGVVEAVMRDYELPELRVPAQATRGDAVLLETPSGDTLGLISLSGHLIAASERGWRTFSLEHARRAWRV